VGSIGFAVIQISFASSVNEEFRQILEIRNQESEDRSQLLMSALSTRDKLFNMLAHDLRSPFVALQSGLGILEEYPVPDDKKWVLNEIQDNTRNTLNLLDNTLAWARSQTDNIQFSPKELSVKEILGKLSHNFSFHYRAKNINIHLESGEKIHAFADPDMLASILQNLISNAIKFTPKGGDIWISVVAVNNGTEFRIRDSGTGMTKEEVAQILSGGTFSKPGTGREKGHGVGLLLVREFLSRHDCELVIKSAKEMGTEFSFMLPHSQKSGV
jgi:signal transduction histidine kinase